MIPNTSIKSTKSATIEKLPKQVRSSLSKKIQKLNSSSISKTVHFFPKDPKTCSVRNRTQLQPIGPKISNLFNFSEVSSSDSMSIQEHPYIGNANDPKRSSSPGFDSGFKFLEAIEPLKKDSTTKSHCAAHEFPVQFQRELTQSQSINNEEHNKHEMSPRTRFELEFDGYLLDKNSCCDSKYEKSKNPGIPAGSHGDGCNVESQDGDQGGRPEAKKSEFLTLMEEEGLLEGVLELVDDRGYIEYPRLREFFLPKNRIPNFKSICYLRLAENELNFFK